MNQTSKNKVGETVEISLGSIVIEPVYGIF